MKAAIIIAATLLAAAAAANDAPQAESGRGLAAALYYRISFPAAGEDANASWGGGGVRFRVDWSDAVAFAAAFGYDRHEFPASESIPEIYKPGEGLERQLLSFRGGAVHDFPTAPVYPYAGGGFTLAREKTYFRDSRLKAKVLYHPGLYAEAGTAWPFAGPLALDVGPELAILFGKRVAAYDPVSNGYRYDDGAALYVGIRAGVALSF